MLRNETDVVGGGYGGGGFGEGGILGLIALLALFRGNLFGGNHEGAQANIAEIENQLANVRADIGDVKYDGVVNTLNQTNALMSELCNGKFENAKAVWEQTSRLQGELFGIQKDILVSNNETNVNILRGNNETNLNIVRMGFENQLNNERQTNVLQRQIGDCCCETNRNIERTAFATQYRDLENKNSTDRQLEEIKCLVKDTAKEQELFALRRESERNFIAGEIRRSTAANVNATIDSWWAAKTFNGATYPQPPYFYGVAV
jgi:hypothetical protein